MVQDSELAANPAKMKSFLRETALEGVLEQGDNGVANGDPMLLVTNGMAGGGGGGGGNGGGNGGRGRGGGGDRIILKRKTRSLMRAIKRSIVGAKKPVLRY